MPAMCKLLVVHSAAADAQAPDAARQTQRSLADIIMEKIRAQQAASGEAPPSECVLLQRQSALNLFLSRRSWQQLLRTAAQKHGALHCQRFR